MSLEVDIEKKYRIVRSWKCAFTAGDETLRLLGRVGVRQEPHHCAASPASRRPMQGKIVVNGKVFFDLRGKKAP